MSKKKKLLIIICAAVLILIVSVAVVLILNSNNDDTDTVLGDGANKGATSEELTAAEQKEDADNHASSQGLDFKLNESRDGYVCIGLGSCSQSEIVIDTHNRLPVTAIDNVAFRHCLQITSVVLGNSVKTVGDAAFEGCENLVSVTFGENLETIGSDSFMGCGALDGELVLDGVVKIGAFAFKGCENIDGVKFGEHIELIADSAFYSCKQLASIEWHDSEFSIGRYVFADTLYTNNLDNYEEDGALYIYDCLILAPENCEDNYQIKPGTKSIASGAFENQGDLKSIVIPDSVVVIYAGFFDCLNLESIIVPKSVKVFYDATGELAHADIYYCGTKEEWRQIEGYKTHANNTHFDYAA